MRAIVRGSSAKSIETVIGARHRHSRLAGSFLFVWLMAAALFASLASPSYPPI
jgi:hypothetical protein